MAPKDLCQEPNALRFCKIETVDFKDLPLSCSFMQSRGLFGNHSDSIRLFNANLTAAYYSLCLVISAAVHFVIFLCRIQKD